jgi:membrane protein YdbS with pleckstrin-like domain
MPSELVQRLRKIPLFAHLGRDDIKAVSRLVKREQYPAGHVLGRQGEMGRTAYIIESGEVLFKQVDAHGVEREIGKIGAGVYFGETSLLLGEPRDATAVVAQDATLLCISKDDLDTLLARHSEMLKVLNMRSDVAQKHHAQHVDFKWLDEGERVLVCQHRHNVILLRSIIVPMFVILIVLIGTIYWYRTDQTMVPIIVGGAVIVVLLVFTLYLVMDHRDERYIVTNKRVVRRDHTPLGRESRVDAPLHTIQDIQESQVGLLTQLYNFGDLIIETAGERGHVAFREVPDPEGVREIIFEQIRRSQSGAKVAERAAIRQDMRRYFETQTVTGSAATPAMVAAQERPRPTFLDLLRKPFDYFLPALCYERGDTITWRKHWIALLKPIAPPTLLGLVATVLAIYWLWQNPANAVATMIVYGVVLVFLAPWWLWRFDDWQNDIYQVTSTRIIDVERLPFFLREDRREASLGVIQNIQFEIPGTLAKMLNYGSVTIETAGAGAFTFDLVKDPGGVQAEIFRRIEAFRKRQVQASAEQHRTELLDWFAVYDQVRSSAPSAPPSPAQRQEP